MKKVWKVCVWDEGEGCNIHGGQRERNSKRRIAMFFVFYSNAVPQRKLIVKAQHESVQQRKKKEQTVLGNYKRDVKEVRKSRDTVYNIGARRGTNII